MRTVVIGLLSISLIATIGAIGISRMNVNVPSAEATHQTAVVILGCGPVEDGSTYLVEAYSASANAPALGRVADIEDSCAQALADFMHEDFTVMGIDSGAFTHGHGALYTLSIASITHVIDDD